MQMLVELIIIILMVSGAFLIMVAALGLYRFPDMFLRMAATSKTATLGAALVMIAMALYFPAAGTITRALLTTVFLLLTAPIAAHMIGRAAYVRGVELWERTVIDEMRGRYDWETHRLASENVDDSSGATASSAQSKPHTAQ